MILLLHGLGANGGVWAELEAFLAEPSTERRSAPDLPGHGAAARHPSYSFGSLAAAVAAELDSGEPVDVIGHSLGGVVGLELANGTYGVDVRTVVALGVKVAWTEAELTKAQSLAAKPPATFASREDAATRFLLVSGLTGLVGTDHSAVVRGITNDGGAWQLTADPATIGVGAPDMRALLAGAKSKVVLARGEHDPLQTTAQLRELEPSAVELPGLGHNAQVEDPAAVWKLVRS